MSQIRDAYEWPYKMRQVGRNGLNIIVSIPPAIIKKEAKKRNLTVAEFIEKFRAVAQYNSFDGVHYYFKEASTTHKELDRQKV